ncbi:MAG: hypothetical protein WAU47_15185 [Desulfobaccales bacterium]
MAGFGVQKLLGAILLSLLCIAGLPGAGKAVSPGKTQSQEPEIFRQLGATVVSLKFFATEKNQAGDVAGRVYKKHFLQDESHYIWYELHLDARAKRPGPVRLKDQATLYIPGEKPLTRVHLFTIPPEIRQVYLTGSCKADMPEGGWWFPGSYRLALSVDNQEVASGTFEVGMY